MSETPKTRKVVYDPLTELTLEQIRLIGRKLNHLGTLIISLAGGEPLMRKDIYDIITSLTIHGRYRDLCAEIAD